MSHNLNDPRVRKTRRSLRNALIQEILKKGYDAVSIQDIVNEAETARITFYRHYSDKEELLQDCLNGLYEELSERTEKNIRADPSPLLPTLMFFRHLEEQEQLYRILFLSRGSQTVMAKMKFLLTQRIIEAVQLFDAPERPPIPDEIIAYHMVNGHLGLGVWWLENDKPYPVEYMAEIALWLSLGGTLRAIGKHDFDLPLPNLP